MPGKKSLKKMEKVQDAETPKEEKKKEKVVGSVDGIRANSPELIEAMKKMKAITPPSIASQFNLKVSVAKKMLEALDGDGQITVDEAYAHMARNVPNATGQDQHPVKWGAVEGHLILGILR